MHHMQVQWQRLRPSSFQPSESQARQARHPEGQVGALLCNVEAEPTQKLNLNIKCLKPNCFNHARDFSGSAQSHPVPLLLSAAVALLVSQENPFVGVEEPLKKERLHLSY